MTALPPECETPEHHDAVADARRMADSLSQWPFGGADSETVRAVAQAEALEDSFTTPSRLANASDAASVAMRDEPQLPSQRSATLRIPSTPPPNPYAEAERRIQARFHEAARQEASA